jgi:exosortase D (VPLPA-CTERM-specific)
MLKTIEDIRITPVSWLKVTVFSGVMLLVYYSTLKWLVFHDWVREDYSYCIAIPFVVIYLLWEKRGELAATHSYTSFSGFIPFAVGILLFWIGELGGELFSLYLSLWFVLVGLIWVHMGWQKIKALAFSLIVILAMFPFPNLINNHINFQLRLISSRLGVGLLHLFGMSAYREGNVIDLGFTKLQVIDACSGLRYIIPLMIMALLLAYWFKARMWKKVVLFLSSIPLAIFFNSFRIAATGVLYRFFGAETAEGFFHAFSSWLIFMFSIPVLLLFMVLLKKIGIEKTHENVECSIINVELDTEKIKHSKFNTQHSLTSPMFLISVSILMATFVLSHTIDFRQKVPIARSFDAFPLQVGEWSGTRAEMDTASLASLKFSDYIITNFQNSKGQSINFYVAYYQDQRKGESIHSPETCLPGSGWEFKEAGAIKMALNGGSSSMPANRSFMEKAGEKELVYYWFPMRGRVLTSIYQMKIYNFWDALTRHRSDGALVRVITPVYEKEEVSAADARLIAFVREIQPILQHFLPE